MFAIVIVLALLSDGRFACPPQEYDLIEVNTVRQEGRFAYTQVLFRNWSPDYRRYQTHAWMIPRKLSEFPVKAGRKWVSKWSFGELSFHITAKMYQETETDGDPETYERRFLFKEDMRTPLMGRQRR